MLQFIRDRAQSWIAFVIVGMLIIGLSTVAWESFFGPDPEVSVAKINGENITVNDFQRPKNYVENNLRSIEQFQRAIQHKTIYPISPMYSLYPKLYQKHQAGVIELSHEEVDQIEFQLFVEY